MLEHLFGSKTRYRLIKLFFREPERRFFVREMTRLLDTQINAIRRELIILCDAGVVEEIEEVALPDATDLEHRGPKKKYYRLHRGSLLYPELQALLLKEKMLTEQEFIQRLKEKGGEIELLIMSGCFMSDKTALTDMLIVGKVKERTIEKIIREYEQELGIQLRYTFMSKQEFDDRRHVMDKFIFGVFESAHMKIINELGI